MKTYTKEELNDILRLHKLWQNDAENGVQANLSEADLSRSNLSGADLSGAHLSRAYLNLTKISDTEYLVKTLFINGSRNLVSWYGCNKIQIGCHKKDIDWWLENYKVIGKREGYTPDQIAEYKTYIDMCKQMQESANLINKGK